MKPKEELLKLLNLELDGELDSAGSQRINRLCVDDPALAAIRESYSTLNRHLAAVPEVEPPAGLRRSILLRFDEQAQLNSEPASSNWLASLLDIFTIPRVRWASSFALVVIAATVGVYWATGPGSESGIEETRLSGTVGSPAGSFEMSETAQPVRLDGVEGMLVLRRVASGVELEMQLHSAKEIVLDVVPTTEASFSSPALGGSTPGLTLTNEANRVRVSGKGGIQQSLTWLTSRAPVYLTVRAFVSDEAVGEWELSLD